MILFTLRCGEGHDFEGWFRDGQTYDAQAAAGAITCPTCGDTRIGKAPMAPRLARHHGSRESEGAGAGPAAPPGAEAAETARALMRTLRRAVESSCDYVGDRFPEEARRIHYGETKARPIYGEATEAQARDLADEGVEVRAVPWISDGN